MHGIFRWAGDRSGALLHTIADRTIACPVVNALQHLRAPDYAARFRSAHVDAPRLLLLLLLLHDHQVGCAQHVLYVVAQLLAVLQSHQGPALLRRGTPP